MNFLNNYKSLVDDVISTRKSLTTEAPNNCLPLWIQWYNGLVPTFHYYNLWNGQRDVQRTKKRLNMAKRGCEDWASLLMSENVKVVIDDQERLDKLLRKVKFWVKTNRAVEVGFALGYAGVVVDIKNLTYDTNNGEVIKNDKTDVGLSYYKATQVIPIEFDNGDIIQCAFVAETSATLSINFHLLDKESGEYHIMMYRKDKESGNEKCFDLNTKSKEPLFAIISPNIENNIFIDSLYPISIFANAIDTLQALDTKYDTSDIEFVNGKKRIFVSAQLVHYQYSKDSDGNEIATKVNTFDENDASVWVVPPDKDEKNLIYAPNDPLRVNDIVAGIHNELNIFSAKIGLGTNYYRFDIGGVATATQVISEKDDAYRNKKKHEQLLEPALATIVKALIYCNNTFTNNEQIQEQEPRILFDDSIIQDKEAEQRTDQANLQNGSMSLVEYRMKYFGDDEDTAREKIYEINGRIGLSNRLNKFLIAFQQGAMPPKMFANLVYTDDDLKACGMSREELLAFFENNKTDEISLSDINLLGGYNPTEPDSEKQTEEVEEPIEEKQEEVIEEKE